MKKFILILILALKFCCFAQETITVEKAVALAKDNNFSIKQTDNSLKLLEKKKNYSWNNVSPSFDVSGRKGFDFESDSTSWSITGSAKISLAPSLFTSIENAKLNYENGLISYDETVRSVELNVRKLFYALLFANENIALQKRNIESAKNRYLTNKNKYSRGQLSELELLQSQYNYESLKPVLETSVITYDNDIATFKQTLGIAQDSKIELLGTLESAMFTRVAQEKKLESDSSIVVYGHIIDLDEIPSIKKVLNSIELQKNTLLATRFSSYAPSLSASYSYGKSGNSTSNKITTSNSISLGVSIPLDGYMPWSSSALNVETQKTTLENLLLKLDDQKTTEKVSIQNRIKKITQQQSQIDLLKQNIVLAQKTYDMTLDSYNHGGKDLITLQDSSDKLLKAKTDLQEKTYNLICSVLELENILGVPFGTLGK